MKTLKTIKKIVNNNIFFILYLILISIPLYFVLPLLSAPQLIIAVIFITVITTLNYEKFLIDVDLF